MPRETICTIESSELGVAQEIHEYRIRKVQ